jgi:iron complex transport system ATP-binding protein
LIGAKNLGVGYPNHTVLEALNLELKAGQVTALLGANGSGKSTLLRSLAGLQPALSGQCTGASTLPPEQRRKQLAYLPQRLPKPPALAARDLVLLGADKPRSWRPSKDAQERAKQAMTMVDVASLSERLCCTLSGGEYRRVGLAAVLTQGANILLLDEPCAGLDLPHASATMQGLRAWVAQDPDARSVLLAVHDLNLAAQWTDRCLLLGDRQLLADGAPEEVLAGDALEHAFGGQLQRFRHPERGHLVVLGAPR